MNWLLFFCVLGVCLSGYAVHVENMKDTNPDFEALCDINASVSCSKVFSSEQGKIWSYFGLIPKDSLLDVPNAVYGMAFYVLIIVLDQAFSKSALAVKIMLLAAVFGCMLSLYLAYVLKFVLQDFCIVCVSSYLCNIVVLFGAISRYNLGTAAEKQSKSR